MNLPQFLATLKPLAAGRAERALLARRRHGREERALHELIERLVAAGAVVDRRQVLDTRAQNAAQRRANELRDTAPLSNPKHPLTIECEELNAELRRGFYVTQRTLLMVDKRFFAEDTLGRAALDYAEALVAARTARSAETTT